MKYTFCRVSVSPLRSEPDDRSELVSQLLFGEKAEILESRNNWIRLKNKFDGYEGWTDRKQHLEISEEEFRDDDGIVYTSENFNMCVKDGEPLILPLGSELIRPENGLFHSGEHHWEYLGEFQKPEFQKSDLADLVHLWINTPYLWGGKSIFGIDCSGLVQQAYKFTGTRLPRDSAQQAELGEPLSFVEEAEPGDLAFFDNEEGKIIHVGMILSGNRIIHAHGSVRIDPLDVTGIFNTDSQSYSHKLRVIKKIL